MAKVAEKTLDFIDRIIDFIILLAFLIVFLVGIYIVADVSYVFYHATAGSVHIQRPTIEEAALTLSDLSDEAIAWLTLDDTKIDYPIMHGDDNAKYLNLDPQGNYNLAGSIFMDSRNDGTFNEPYTLIYGHHMSNDYMFGALDHYEQEDYFDKHRTGTIMTGDGRELHLNIFAFAVLDAHDEEVFTPGYAYDIHEYIRTNAKIYRENNGGRIVALTTCREPGMTTRSLVFCEIIE